MITKWMKSKQQRMDGFIGFRLVVRLVIQWLHEHRTEGCTTNAMDFAARNGHLEIVQWLHDNRTEGCTDRAMDGAAEYGHYEVVQYLYENRTEGLPNNSNIH